jgi:hypothetical protein
MHHRNLQESILNGASTVASSAFSNPSSGGGIQQEDERSALIQLGDLVAANKWARQVPSNLVPIKG